MQQLTGRIAVVTGAASGIGLGIAQAFADSGMNVMMTDVDEERLERQVAGIGTDRAAGMVCDVADPFAVEVLADETSNGSVQSTSCATTRGSFGAARHGSFHSPTGKQCWA